MKWKVIIICFFLLACSDLRKEMPEGILTEEVFINILKEVHLTEANFELQKTNNNQVAQKNLEIDYQKIYNEYNIDGQKFQLTLDYYANHPGKLEDIYGKVIEELVEQRANLDQQ